MRLDTRICYNCIELFLYCQRHSLNVYPSSQSRLLKNDFVADYKDKYVIKTRPNLYIIYQDKFFLAIYICRTLRTNPPSYATEYEHLEKIDEMAFVLSRSRAPDQTVTRLVERQLKFKGIDLEMITVENIADCN